MAEAMAGLLYFLLFDTSANAMASHYVEPLPETPTDARQSARERYSLSFSFEYHEKESGGGGKYKYEDLPKEKGTRNGFSIDCRLYVHRKI